MSRRSLILLLALFASVSIAQQGPQDEMEPQFPQQQSAGDLLNACASSRLTSVGRERRRYCAGFVGGVEETIRLLHLGRRSEMGLCTPANVTASELADAFIRYGASHKGELKDPAAAVVLHALAEAYPCGGKP
jgi:hypothetical protein